MSAEFVTAFAAVFTALVIGASAVAALIQLRHMRASNQLDAVLSLERDFRGEDLQNALRYMQEKLPEKLRDPAYRAELERRGFVDQRVHPEVIACNWFNTMGTLLKHRLVSEATFMDMFGRLIVYCWETLEPVVGIMRRTRGEAQYDEFEYLALRAKLWLEGNRSSAFPRDVVRRPVKDSWADQDPATGEAITR